MNSTKLSCVLFFAIPWTVAHQVPLPMEFSRQECWSDLLFPATQDVPKPGIEHESLSLAGRFFTTMPPGKSYIYINSFNLYDFDMH